MTEFKNDQERINDQYYPTHLLSFNFDGHPICERRGRVETTMNGDDVTCSDCLKIMADLTKPKERGTNDRQRIKLTVYVDLDPAPGAFHTPESAHQITSNLFRTLMPHYNPTVSLEH